MRAMKKTMNLLIVGLFVGTVVLPTMSGNNENLEKISKTINQNLNIIDDILDQYQNEGDNGGSMFGGAYAQSFKPTKPLFSYLVKSNWLNGIISSCG